MRNILSALVVAGFFPGASSAASGKWPYQKTDEVVIKIVDDTTQKPIPGVLLEGVWLAEKLASGFESRSKELQRAQWITDASGQVDIPEFSAIDMAVSLKGLWITGKHPLYSNIDVRLFGQDDREHYTDIMKNEISHSTNKVNVVAHIPSLKTWAKRFHCVAKRKKDAIYRDGVDDSCRQFPLSNITRSSEYFLDHRFTDKFKDLAPSRDECMKQWGEFIDIAYRDSPLIPVIDPKVFVKETLAEYRERAGSKPRH